MSLEEIEKVVSEEIARLAKTGPTPAELARAKTKQEFQFVTALEGIGGFGGKADRLNQYNTYLGDPGKLEWDMARYKNATTESVRQAVGEVPRHEEPAPRPLPRREVRAGHGGRGRPLEGAADRRGSALRRARRSRRRSCPTGWTSSSSSAAELPKVDVTFVTRAGAEADPAGKAGLAHMTATQIDMGTATRKALEIEDALGDLGIGLTAAAGPGERARRRSRP